MLNKLALLCNHSGIVKYFFNTSWLMLEQFLRLVAGVFIGIYVARYLGPEQYGVMSYCMAYTAIFASFANLGLDSIVVRELVNFPEKRDKLIGTAFWLKFGGAIIALIVILFFISMTEESPQNKLFIIIIASSMLFQSFLVVDMYFQANVKAKVISICRILQLIFLCVLKLYLIIIEASLIAFVSLSLVSSLTLAIILLIAYYSTTQRFIFTKFSLSVAKSYLSDSWPLIVSSLVITLYLKIDKIMIQFFLDSEEVGIYSASAKIAEIWYFVPMLITKSIYPAILSAKRVSKEKFNNRMQQLYCLMIWLSIAISVTIYCSSEFIVGLFGSSFYASNSVLKVHIWASIFVFLGTASSKWLLTENLQYYSMLNTAVGASINVLLNYRLIPLWGVVGAAYSTLISQAFAAVIMNLFHKKTRENFYLQISSFNKIKLI